MHHLAASAQSPTLSAPSMPRHPLSIHRGGDSRRRRARRKSGGKLLIKVRSVDLTRRADHHPGGARVIGAKDKYETGTVQDKRIG